MPRPVAVSGRKLYSFKTLPLSGRPACFQSGQDLAGRFGRVIPLYGTLGPAGLRELLTAVRRSLRHQRREFPRQSSPRYDRTIIRYLSEHELQEINLFLGVRRWASGTLELSFTKQRRGWALVFLPQVTPSARNGAKLLSSDSAYIKFGFQFSKVLTVSDFERLQCFGNSCFVSILGVDCAWATKMPEESTY